MLPTGEVASVAGTAFDFRAERAVAPMPPPGVNNTFCLSERPWRPPALAATLRTPSGPKLEVWTPQAGLHLYNGYRLADHGGGLDGRRHGPRGGICLEAQGWPDSPGNPAFPQSVLRPGETYRQVTRYRLA